MSAPMWTCSLCGRSFANRNQTHSCGPLLELDRHFSSGAPFVRQIFDRVLEEAIALGPVTVLPEKTRIALQARMSFAAFIPRSSWLDGHFVLAEKLDSPRFRRVEVFSPRNVLHTFRLSGISDVDQEFRGWLARAYRVGSQRHR